MKIHYIEEKYDCLILGQSEMGLLEVVTSVFHETTWSDFKGHYDYKIKWLGTIKQKGNDLVNVTYEEYWRIEFDNAPNSLEVLTEIIDSSFNSVEIVFNEYTNALAFGEMPVHKDKNFIEGQAQATLKGIITKDDYKRK